jgi:tape measure domain-containing protein
MPTESATAYVSIIPSAREFGADLARQIDPTGLGTSLGNQVSGGLSSSLKRGLQGAATGTIAAAAAAIGASLVKGFARLTSIDQATAKLRGLGNSAEDITKIMDNALGAVRGTAFGLDAASTVAAAAVASGIKPGKDLEGVLKTIADTATIAGASMEDTGAIFNSVAARGKLQGDDLMQLQSRGVPVLAFLAKHYGITAQAASDMVSKGSVDFENSAAAMQENLGGAALSSGDTFTGAMANVFASLGRIGANLEKGFFPKLAPLFQTITSATGPLEDRAGALGSMLGEKINPVLDRLSNLLTNGTNAFKGMGSVLAPLGGAFAALGAGGLGGLLAAIPGLGGLAGPLAALSGPLGLIAGAFGGLVAISPDLQAALSTAGQGPPSVSSPAAWATRSHRFSAPSSALSAISSMKSEARSPPRSSSPYPWSCNSSASWVRLLRRSCPRSGSCSRSSRSCSPISRRCSWSSLKSPGSLSQRSRRSSSPWAAHSRQH